MKTKNILIIADQLIDILEHIHDNGYAHSDIKAENIMIAKCTFAKKKNATDGRSVLVTKNGNGRGHNRSRRKNGLILGYHNQHFDGNGDVGEVNTTDVVDGNGNDDSKRYDESENCTISEFDRLKDMSSSHSYHPDVVEFGSGDGSMNRASKLFDDIVMPHYLRRPTKKVNYCENENDDDKPVPKEDGEDGDDDWTRKHQYAKRIYHKSTVKIPAEVRRGAYDCDDTSNTKSNESEHGDNGTTVNQLLTTEDRIHLIDFGLALKFVDSNGMHRPFVMDQRRAHDGTLEFTSRDAHMGAHSRRSDLECLAYNLIYWKEGFLPWKNEKVMSQPEQVHRLKEYFMTDIKQMYKNIYNVPIPTFINDFLTHVANLAYHERPNYKLCKEIFRKESQRLGCKRNQMILSVADLRASPVHKPVTEESEAHQIGHKLLDAAKLMKMGLIPPFCETPTSQAQVSPKNLRSKSTQCPSKRHKKFSWTEILSTDPDQIARQRAEKEFEREEQCDQTPMRRYSGRPTYAILQIENSKLKPKLDNQTADVHGSENTIKGYTKPMMDVWRKRQLYLLEQFQINPSGDSTSAQKASAVAKSQSASSPSQLQNGINGHGKVKRRRTKRASEPKTETNCSALTNGGDTTHESVQPKNDELTPLKAIKSRKRKSGLRLVVTPTKKIISFRNNNSNRRRKTASTKAMSHTDTVTTSASAPSLANHGRDALPTDDISNCSFNNVLSEASSHSSHATACTASIHSDEDEHPKRHTKQSKQSTADTKNRLEFSDNRLNRHRHQQDADRAVLSQESVDENDATAVPAVFSTKTRHAKVRANTALKPIALSDEESRDTTDYSPVKTRHKRPKDGKHNRRGKKRSNGRGEYSHKFHSIARQVSSVKVLNKQFAKMSIRRDRAKNKIDSQHRNTA